MDTVLIEITDKRAYQFLQGLEELNVIKLINRKEDNEEENPTAEFLGALQLTDKEHNSLIQHIETVRNEWQSNF